MSASAPPRRRRIVIDVRLVIGIGLVTASVAGVVSLVSASDRRITVYAAAETFTPGDRIGEDELLPRQVTLDDAEGLYLREEPQPRRARADVRARHVGGDPRHLARARALR
jgi:hypothetical protein